MVGVALLDLAIATLVLVVVGLQTLRRHRDLRGDRIQPQLGVLQPHRLRTHVIARMAVVPGFDPGVVKFGGRLKVIRCQQRIAQFALFVLQSIDAIDLRRCQKVRQLDGFAQLADLQRLAPLGKVAVLGHAELCQHALGYPRIVFSIGLKRRLVEHRLAHLRVGGVITRLLRALAQQRLAHVFIDQLLLQQSLLRHAHLGAVERLLVLRLTLLPGAVERFGADTLVVDLQAVVGRAEADVDDAVSAPDGEDQCQHSEDYGGQPALTFQFVA